MGLTGVGKTTLFNYLIGKKLRLKKVQISSVNKDLPPDE